MPKILGMNSFSGRDPDMDQLIITAGSITYDTVTIPGDSPSSTSITGPALSFRAPWYDNENGAIFEPATAEYWLLFRYYTIANSSLINDTLRLGSGRNGDYLISISAEDSSNKITIWVEEELRAVATVDAYSLSVWERIHLHVEGDQLGDVISVYLDGDLNTPVLTYALVGADVTNLAAIGAPNEFRCTFKQTTGDHLDDIVALDPADPAFEGIEHYADWGVKDGVFTGNHAPEQEWTGGYTEIDERPAVDTDKIVAANVGDKATFTKAAVGEPNVFGFKVYAGVQRTGTAAGQNLTIGLEDDSDAETVTVAAPGDGVVSHIFQTAQDALAHSPTKLDAARVSFTAAT